MKKNRTKKLLSILLAVLLAALALPTVAFAEDGDGDGDGYDDGDVAAVQAIINASDMLKEEYDVNDPDTWVAKGLVTWNDETPKRATKLSLQISENEYITDFSGTLDASALTALEALFCPQNIDLKELILPQTESLTQLECYMTSITELDISYNPGLEHLSVYYTNISVLDVSNNTDLTSLDCEGTNVSSLELSKLSNLAYLWCNGTNITALDVSDNPELTFLCCANTGITVLDVSKNTKLETLVCSGTQITALNLSANQSLTTISCPESLAQIVTPGGYHITITQTSGGMITLYREDNNGTPIYKLTASADPHYEFIRWNGVTDFIDGTTKNDAAVEFNVTGDMEISADFQVEVRLTLSSLAIEGATLTPEFSGRVLSYTASVPYNTTSINIVAQGQSGYEHKITGTGVHELNVGGNTFVVTVIVPKMPGTSNINVPEETITQEYVITVARQAKEDSSIGLWIGLAVIVLVAGAACIVVWRKKRTT